MKQFLKWIGTLVEDKQGSISSKRVGFIYCLFMLHRAIYVPNINDIVILTIAGLALGLVGLTIPEWFSNLKK